MTPPLQEEITKSCRKHNYRRRRRGGAATGRTRTLRPWAACRRETCGRTGRSRRSPAPAAAGRCPPRRPTPQISRPVHTPAVEACLSRGGGKNTEKKEEENNENTKKNTKKEISLFGVPDFLKKADIGRKICQKCRKYFKADYFDRCKKRRRGRLRVGGGVERGRLSHARCSSFANAATSVSSSV